MQRQGIHFPKVEEPVKLYYKFDDDLDKLFSETLAVINKISYARYEPVNYLKTRTITEDLQIQKVGQENVRGFMKGLLVKRLESSFYAFKMTLGRFIDSYDKFIAMFDKGTVYLSKKVDVYDLLESDYEEILDELFEQGNLIKYDASEFQAHFRDLLVADRNYLKKLHERWLKVKDDPKLAELLSLLKNDERLKSNKLLLFTESKETGKYLFDELEKKYGDETIFISGSSKSKEFEKVRRNFDPKARVSEDEKRILVTTDILSEGINLHKANIVINYDIPWNSIRILQRVGRVNRIGTKHEQIYIYNFFPTSQSEQQIGLEKLAVAKIQAFHDTLGEDTRYLTGEEEFNSWEIFSRINSSKIVEEEADKDVESELNYLKQIRTIRDEDSKLFEKVKKLPIKARTSRENSAGKGQLVTFFRHGSLRKFFKAKGKQSEEILFFEAAKLLIAKPGDKKTRLVDDFHSLLEKNTEAFEASIRDEADDATEKRGGGSEKSLVKTSKSLLDWPGITEDDEIYLNTLIRALVEGAVSKKSVNRIVAETKNMLKPLAILAEIRKTISEGYLSKITSGDNSRMHVQREIILSECYT